MGIGGMIRKGLTILLAVAILAGLLAYLSGAFRNRIEPSPVAAEERRLTPDQKTDEIHKVIDIETVEVAGTLRAERRTAVSARIMAAIVEMNARAGNEVKEGDVLVRLDDRDLKAGLAQSRQGVLAAQARLRNAEEAFNRFQSLLKEKVASQAEYDASEAEYRVAQATLSQARDSESAAQTLLSFSVIRAPVGGIVIDKLADVGDTATPGRPLLTIYDPSALRLEAAAPEAIALGLTNGQRLKVRIGTLPEDESLEGVIEEIVPEADVASRSVLVKVRVPKAPGLVEGAFGRLLIPTRERIRLCLPLSAVREVGQLRFVDVAAEDGRLERRQVKLSDHSRMGRVEVLAGVGAGERVVLYGPPPPPIPEGVRLFDEGDAPSPWGDAR